MEPSVFPPCPRSKASPSTEFQENVFLADEFLSSEGEAHTTRYFPLCRAARAFQAPVWPGAQWWRRGSFGWTRFLPIPSSTPLCRVFAVVQPCAKPGGLGEKPKAALFLASMKDSLKKRGAKASWQVSSPSREKQRLWAAEGVSFMKSILLKIGSLCLGDKLLSHIGQNCPLSCVCVFSDVFLFTSL